MFGRKRSAERMLAETIRTREETARARRIGQWALAVAAVTMVIGALGFALQVATRQGPASTTKAPDRPEDVPGNATTMPPTQIATSDSSTPGSGVASPLVIDHHALADCDDPDVVRAVITKNQDGPSAAAHLLAAQAALTLGDYDLAAAQGKLAHDLWPETDIPPEVWQAWVEGVENSADPATRRSSDRVAHLAVAAHPNDAPLLVALSDGTSDPAEGRAALTAARHGTRLEFGDLAIRLAAKRGADVDQLRAEFASTYAEITRNARQWFQAAVLAQVGGDYDEALSDIDRAIDLGSAGCLDQQSYLTMEKALILALSPDGDVAAAQDMAAEARAIRGAKWMWGQFTQAWIAVRATGPDYSRGIQYLEAITQDETFTETDKVPAYQYLAVLDTAAGDCAGADAAWSSALAVERTPRDLRERGFVRFWCLGTTSEMVRASGSTDVHEALALAEAQGEADLDSYRLDDLRLRLEGGDATALTAFEDIVSRGGYVASLASEYVGDHAASSHDTNGAIAAYRQAIDFDPQPSPKVWWKIYLLATDASGRADTCSQMRLAIAEFVETSVCNALEALESDVMSKDDSRVAEAVSYLHTNGERRPTADTAAYVGSVLVVLTQSRHGSLVQDLCVHSLVDNAATPFTIDRCLSIGNDLLDDYADPSDAKLIFEALDRATA